MATVLLPPKQYDLAQATQLRAEMGVEYRSFELPSRCSERPKSQGQIWVSHLALLRRMYGGSQKGQGSMNVVVCSRPSTSVC